MAVTINGTTGIANDGGYTGDGVVFADTTPANTLVTTTGGNVGIGTSSPGSNRLYINAPDGTAPLTLNSAGGSDTTRALNFNVAGDNYGKILVPSGSGGAMAFWTGGANAAAERARIDSSGNFLVGTTSGSGRIRMKQSADAHSGAFNIENFGNTNTWSFLIGSDNNLYFGYNGTSRGVFNNSTGAYTTISDRSLKKDIAEIQYGLDSVLALRPVSYMMKDQAEGERKTLGFIAQEVDEVVPESVFLMREDLYGMDKEALIPVLVKAIQEQQAIITALTARVTALEGA